MYASWHNGGLRLDPQSEQERAALDVLRQNFLNGQIPPIEHESLGTLPETIALREDDEAFYRAAQRESRERRRDGTDASAVVTPEPTS